MLLHYKFINNIFYFQKNAAIFILSIIKEKLASIQLKDAYKLIPTAFQRKRKLTFEFTLLIMINL